MTVDYTTTALLSAIRRKGSMPSNAKLTSAEMLLIADDEMRALVLPALLTVRDDYFVVQQDIPIVANQSEYNALRDAQSSTIMSVSLKRNSDGKVWVLPRLSIGQIDTYSNVTQDYPSYYALQGDSIVLLPKPTTTAYTLRVRYERLPGRLVATTDCAVPTASGATSITVASAPVSWATGMRVQAVQSCPPFSTTMGPASVSNLAANVLTLGTPDYGAISNVALSTAGGFNFPDYVCAWNETCVVPLPDAWQPVMIYAATSAVLRETGASQQADELKGETLERINRLVKLQSNRVRKQPLAVFDRKSPLRRSGL